MTQRAVLTSETEKNGENGCSLVGIADWARTGEKTSIVRGYTNELMILPMLAVLGFETGGDVWWLVGAMHLGMVPWLETE